MAGGVACFEWSTVGAVFFGAVFGAVFFAVVALGGADFFVVETGAFVAGCRVVVDGRFAGGVDSRAGAGSTTGGDAGGAVNSDSR